MTTKQANRGSCDELSDRVLAYLSLGPATTTDIADGLGIQWSTAVGRLIILAKRQKVERLDDNGKPFQWRLRRDDNGKPFQWRLRREA